MTRPSLSVLPWLRRHARWLLLLVAVAVMLAAGTALWRYFGLGGLGSYTQQAVVFEDADLRLPPALAGPTGRIRVVHFWDPACGRCNRETSAHLRYLIGMYRRAGVDFYSVRRPGTQGELPDYLRGRLQPLDGIEGMARIPASPSVAIWDADGRLAYAGPYSLGMVCTSANSFVEPVIDKLLAGERVVPSGILAVGCYCAMP